MAFDSSAFRLARSSCVAGNSVVASRRCAMRVVSAIGSCVVCVVGMLPRVCLFSVVAVVVVNLVFLFLFLLLFKEVSWVLFKCWCN